MGFLAAIFGGIFTGGGATILAVLGKFLPGIASTIGDIWLKAKQTQVQSDANGVTLAHSYLENVTEANKARVEARKAEGAWGPIGIVTLLVGLIIAGVLAAFAFHVILIVLDSTPWSLLGLLTPHAIGSWRVATLPKPFDEIELSVIQAMVSTINALFYTAPPAAAAVAVAKVFRGK